MGASRWFFSMSGVILLIGALGDRRQGPELRHRLRVGHADHDGARAGRRRGPGRATCWPRPALRDAKVQKVDEPELGDNVFQISTEELAAARRSARSSGARPGFGVGRQLLHDSIGPTFGKTVANSAIIAIIASLLVISAYIALRFEWKYAVPVLIALMHDLLITAGVYSLHGPGGDDGDGRGAADDPGLLALRHDHRVRPHPRERAADAAGRVLADRQPLDVRGADPVAGDVVLHAAAGPRAAASSAARRCKDFAFALLDRHRLGRVLVDLHRRAGAHALEGARAGLPRARRARIAARARRRVPAVRDRPPAARPVDVEPRSEKRARRAPASPRPDDPERGVSRDEFEELVARPRTTRRRRDRPPRPRAASRRRRRRRVASPRPSPSRRPTRRRAPEDARRPRTARKDDRSAQARQRTAATRRHGRSR